MSKGIEDVEDRDGEGFVNCRSCGRDIGTGDHYCPWCGEVQPVGVAPTGPDFPESGHESGGAGTGAASSGADDSASVEEQLRQLRATVSSQNAALARLSQRLSALEWGRAAPGAPRPPQPQSVPTQPQPQAATPAIPLPDGEADVTLRRPRRGAARYAPAEETAPAGIPVNAGGLSGLPADTFSNGNWEWLLGGNWLARIGVVALIIGVGFFISLAIENGWLGELERVALGLVAGLAFLGAGEYYRRRYAVWAQTITGGGLGIFYLSVYGAFALYGLISPLTAFGGFFLITLAGAALALRHEAMGVAVLSIFGGFATPLLLQERLPDQRLLLAYVLVLDVGVLALASFRNWRWFTLLGWAGSLILFGFWKEELGPSVALAQIGITAIFLIFAGATIAFHVVRQRAVDIPDLALMTLNTAAFYGISYWLMNDPYRPWMGGFTVSVAAFYALLSAACRMRGAAQLNLTLFSAGLAVLFAVLAVPIQLGGPWISVAWGVEGLVLVWLSFPLRMRELRWFGYIMFVVSALWLLAWDTPAAFSQDLTPFWNEYMISYGAAVLLPAMAGYLLHLRRGALEPREETAIPVLALRAAIFAAVVVPIQVDGIWITIAWAAEAVLLLALALRLNMTELRWLSYVLLSAMLLRMLALDTFDLDLETFRPVLNWRFLAFITGITALYSAGWLAIRRNGEPASAAEVVQRQAAIPVLLALANLATLWLLSAEIIASANSALLYLPDDVSENVTSLGLSLLWTFYAAALIVLGVARRWRWVRVAGLALLAVPVIKLFAFDSLQLEQEYRVIAFLVLGLILVAGGLLYQRYSRVVRGFLFE